MADFYRQCWTSDEYHHNKDGYMSVWWAGTHVTAHRLSFFLHHGYWPNICRHTCDNPPCFNPTHLRDGTKADNNRDKMERGRWAGGRGRAARPGMPPRQDNAAYLRERKQRIKAGAW